MAITPPILDIARFRLLFPAFADATLYPDEMIQEYWDTALCFIVDPSCLCYRFAQCGMLALYYMTAHLLALSVIIAGGNVPGMVQSATIDKISVSLTPPPVPNQWQWWLGTTPYGQMLLALLQVRSAGGGYYGGFPELSAYRRAGGVFY